MPGYRAAMTAFRETVATARHRVVGGAARVRDRRPAEPGERTPCFSRLEEASYYTVAAGLYIGAGFFAKQVFAWWTYGAIFFVAFVWAVPALLRRWWPRRRASRRDVRT